MAIGDAAAAAGMDIVPGTTPANTIDTEINKTRDYIVEHPLPRARDGVEGIIELTTIPFAVPLDQKVAASPYAVAQYVDGQLGARVDARVAHDATGNWLRSPNGAAALRADDSGVIFSGNIYNTVVSGSGSYRGVYVNQNAAIGYVPSLRALKELTGDQDIDIDAWLELPLRRFYYKGDDSRFPRLGWFAEDVEAVEADITFADDEGNLAGIDYAAAVVPLLAVIQSLAARITELEQRQPDE